MVFEIPAIRLNELCHCYSISSKRVSAPKMIEWLTTKTADAADRQSRFVRLYYGIPITKMEVKIIYTTSHKITSCYVDIQFDDKHLDHVTRITSKYRKRAETLWHNSQYVPFNMAMKQTQQQRQQSKYAQASNQKMH